MAFAGCSGEPENPAPSDMRPVTAARDEVPGNDVRRMAELSDVRVKLRRNKDGTYSYEISGKNAEAVIDADKKLDAYVSDKDKAKR